MTDDPGRDGAGEDEGGGPIGIFPSWRAVYITILIYTAGLTLGLYVLSRLLDHGSG